MSLKDLDRQSVLNAIKECDRLGRELFLERYKFGRARSYVVLHEGQSYDSKAIVGSAHGHATGTPLSASAFRGGDATVGATLRSLGFAVQSLLSPDWDWQEVVLACDLVEENGWRELRTNDPRVHELSALLRRLPIHPAHQRPANFRSADAVSRKTSDLATVHPDYQGKPTRGGRNDRAVLQRFLQGREEMKGIAAALRSMQMEDLDEVVAARLDDPDDFSAEEGGLLTYLHRRRERDPKLREKKIAEALRLGDGLACRVCEFDFRSAYGSHGEGYIECHHIVPLHVTGRTTNKLEDLILICANCHRMIHRHSPWKSPAELKSIVEDTRSNG